MDQELSLIMFFILSNHNQLEEVAQESGILEINHNYVPQQFKQNCERITPYP